MNKFSVASMDFNDDQVAVTVIREIVMPDDSMISKVAPYTMDRGLFPGALAEGIDDYVEMVMARYAKGLLTLADDMREIPTDEDSDSIEVR